jgi:hypothetical protein
MRTSLAAAIVLLAGFTAAQEPSKAELKKRLKDEAHPDWIYDDLPAAFAEARKSGKPILAVFRCVP